MSEFPIIEKEGIKGWFYLFCFLVQNKYLPSFISLLKKIKEDIKEGEVSGKNRTYFFV